MPDYTNAQKTAIDSIEDHDRYLLRSEAEIRGQLLKLAKKPDIITAYFNNGSNFILTAVLGNISLIKFHGNRANPLKSLKEHW